MDSCGSGLGWVDSCGSGLGGCLVRDSIISEGYNIPLPYNESGRPDSPRTLQKAYPPDFSRGHNYPLFVFVRHCRSKPSLPPAALTIHFSFAFGIINIIDKTGGAKIIRGVQGCCKRGVQGCCKPPQKLIHYLPSHNVLHFAQPQCS